MNDVMVDLETLGTGNNAVIVQLAAVRFDLDSGETGEEFCRYISVDSALSYGLEVDADTLLWWMKQSEEARQSVYFNNPEPMYTVLTDFISFIEPDDKLWGNSARFDLGKLENALFKSGFSTPWKYYNERDVRTLVAFAPEVKKDMPFVDTKHNAIDDCRYQVRYCSEIWSRLRRNEKFKIKD